MYFKLNILSIYPNLLKTVFLNQSESLSIVAQFDLLFRTYRIDTRTIESTTKKLYSDVSKVVVLNQ